MPSLGYPRVVAKWRAICPRRWVVTAALGRNYLVTLSFAGRDLVAPFLRF